MARSRIVSVICQRKFTLKKLWHNVKYRKKVNLCTQVCQSYCHIILGNLKVWRDRQTPVAQIKENTTSTLVKYFTIELKSQCVRARARVCTCVFVCVGVVGEGGKEERDACYKSNTFRSKQ